MRLARLTRSLASLAGLSLLAIAFAGATAPGVALADVVVFTDGRELRGQVVEERPNVIVLRLAQGQVRIPRDRVREIRREDPRDSLLLEGDRLAELGDLAGARQVYERVLDQSPGLGEARERLVGLDLREAEIALAEGRLAAARGLYRSVESASPARARDARAGLERVNARETEARAELAAARAALQAGRPGDAIERYARVAPLDAALRDEVARESARAYVSLASERQRAGDRAGCREAIREALARSLDVLPNVRDAWIALEGERAAEMLDAGDLAGAQLALRDLLPFDAQSRVTLYLLGMLAERQGRGEDAIRLYLRALREEPAGPQDVHALRERAARAAQSGGQPAPPDETLLAVVEAGDFRTARSAHFVIRHHNEALAALLPDVLETARDAARALLGPAAGREWAEPADVIIFPSHEEYLTQGGFTWSAGHASIAAGRGGALARRIISYQQARELVTAVLPHEVAHLAFRSAFEGGSPPPRWAEEGFAQRCEPEHVRRYHLRVLARIILQGRLPDLRDLLARDDYPAGEEAVHAYYATSAGIAFALLERGDAPLFVRCLREAASVGIWEALRRSYGVGTPAELERVLRRQAGAG